ncbi:MULTISPECIES: type VII secretion target [unclassified Actinobaculum]|uniref:type VII secretion target n=1 Tax=unclassified Actinobaculum TaxID=2609299 RepID=UPI000D52990C|nr:MULTISPECIES: type VII secretion target [unclassified Actinobaculum]AWE41539.1 hypothetical protein DDD63_00720 [Actinobaculum sp. 313]RTE48028.1 hypothetical protein EKN07_11185 [Actinobaculum sp. 352]
MSDLTADPEKLRNRADDVDEHAQNIGEVAGASEIDASASALPSESLSDEAVAASDAFTAGKKASVRRLEELASGLRGTAQDFEDTDQQVSASLADLAYGGDSLL